MARGVKIGPPMQNITICLPDDFVTALKDFENAGLVPSRSEAVRLALRDFLREEVSLLLILQKGGKLSERKDI